VRCCAGSSTEDGNQLLLLVIDVAYDFGGKSVDLAQQCGPVEIRINDDPPQVLEQDGDRRMLVSQPVQHRRQSRPPVGNAAAAVSGRAPSGAVRSARPVSRSRATAGRSQDRCGFAARR
jgi:hypothetical protein